jgi:hypothetical protein
MDITAGHICGAKSLHELCRAAVVVMRKSQGHRSSLGQICFAITSTALSLSPLVPLSRGPGRGHHQRNHGCFVTGFATMPGHARPTETLGMAGRGDRLQEIIFHAETKSLPNCPSPHQGSPSPALPSGSSMPNTALSFDQRAVMENPASETFWSANPANDPASGAVPWKIGQASRRGSWENRRARLFHDGPMLPCSRVTKLVEPLNLVSQISLPDTVFSQGGCDTAGLGSWAKQPGSLDGRGRRREDGLVNWPQKPSHIVGNPSRVA